MAKPTSVTTLALGLACQSLLLAAAPPVAAQKRINSKSVSAEVKDDAPAQAPAPVRVGVPPRVVAQPKQKTPGPARPDAMSIQRIAPTIMSVVNFKELSRQQQQAARRAQTSNSTPVMQEAPAPMTIIERDANGATGGDDAAPPAPAAQANDTGGPNVPSPAPSQNFNAQEDAAKVGTGSFTIPPDTMGAVGLDKVFTNVNNNYRVHDKATGAALSTVSIDTFWTGLGATGVFDPRVQYDPINNRWIVSAVSNAQTATSSVLIGVSDTSDAQGTYHLYRFIVGCSGGTSPVTGAACNAAGGEWADFPMLGFNKHYVTVSWNQFTISTSAFVAGGLIAIDYPHLRTGPATPNAFSASIGSAVSGAFCAHPATTLDPNETNVYLVGHISSGGATYRTFTLSGAPPSQGGTGPTAFTGNTIRTRPGGGWTQPGGDIAPQTCVGVVGTTCPTTLRGIDSGDAFVRSNVIMRGGRIYYPQTVSLPAGTAAANDAARLAAQWTVVNPDGTFVDGGRVEDATATKSNGGRHYAYPGIAVNKNNDIILGFTEFESDDFADAAYSFRLGTDPAGTMRDPVVYKEGEDYYSKAFSGTRNRWGDYSHAQVDPSNDRDLWTIQEFAGTRTVPNNLTTTNNSRWGTWWAKVTAPAGAGDLNISEFRLRGPNPNGAQNEFIEIYNNNNSPLTVTTLDGSAGYAVAASDGVARCVIPTGTNIPARGHYLCVNSVGYSLGAYPAGNGTTATGDATYTTDIADNAGIAIFNSATTFDATTRLDAVGSTSEANTLYKEGTGYPALTPFSIDYSFYRDLCGKGGSITTLGPCPTGGYPKDTNDNAADFVFVDTNGTSAGAGQRLGAPGPENLSSPIQRNDTYGVVLVDATTAASAPPNRIRDFTSDPANNSTFGTLTIRRRVVNNTGAPATRLRFRVVDITTFPAPSGFADLRTRTSGTTIGVTVNDPATCSPAPAPCMVNIEGTTVETPPSQLNGGAFNSSYSPSTVTLATPLAPGASINVQFLLGIQQTGTFKFFINVEALP